MLAAVAPVRNCAMSGTATSKAGGATSGWPRRGNRSVIWRNGSAGTTGNASGCDGTAAKGGRGTRVGWGGGGKRWVNWRNGSAGTSGNASGCDGTAAKGGRGTCVGWGLRVPRWGSRRVVVAPGGWLPSRNYIRL